MTDSNVERIFGNYATLDTGAGSIQKQFVFADDTDQIGVHQTDDSMKWFSDDTKQLLLAGPQTITGDKTLSQSVKLKLSSIADIYADATKSYWDTTNNIDIGDAVSSPTVTFLGTTALDIGGQCVFRGEISIVGTKKITWDTGGSEIYESSNEIILDAVSGQQLKFNGSTRLECNSADVTVYEELKCFDSLTVSSGALNMGTNVINLDSDGDIYSDGTDMYIEDSADIYVKPAANLYLGDAVNNPNVYSPGSGVFDITGQAIFRGEVSIVGTRKITWDAGGSEIYESSNQIILDATSGMQFKYNGSTRLECNNTDVTAYQEVKASEGADISVKLEIPNLSAPPSGVGNGDIWMESDGLHIYYGGAEKVVAGV